MRYADSSSTGMDWEALFIWVIPVHELMTFSFIFGLRRLYVYHVGRK